MTSILHIDASAKLTDSVTRLLSADAVATLKKQHPDAKVIYRDLTKDSLPHIGPEFLSGIFAGGEHANHATVKLSDELIDELMSAEVIVIGAPMYNFSIPSQLKSWIDYVVRAGKTFKYTENGPIGLVNGKRAIVAVASGGDYSSGPYQANNHVGPLMTQLFQFIGISDVTVAHAGSQSMGEQAAKASIENAKREIEATALSFK